MNEKEFTEDYIRGYRDGLGSANGLVHANLHLVRMYVESLIEKTTKPPVDEDK